MALDDHANLVALFFNQAKRLGDRPFLWERRDGTYRATTWTEAADAVTALAAALQAYGLSPRDRVALLSPNSPRWAIADFAIMAAGGVTVPVYTTNTAANHEHVITDCGATMAIVANATLARPFLEGARKSPLRRVVAMEPFSGSDSGRIAVTPWEEALADGRGRSDRIAAAAERIDRGALACLIYTSGTGGAPKGVMLSHRAILTNCQGAIDLLAELGLGDETFLSFLPLSHAYEHTAGLMFPVSIGAQIYFAERADTLSTNLAEARPTIMTAVPRLYEILRERISHEVNRQGGLKARLFWKAVELGRRNYEHPGAMGVWDGFLNRIVDRLVRDKIRDRFGGRLKALVSGGAPLNYEVGVFFVALGLRLLQGYGQTEAAPVITCNPCKRVKLRTVGPPLTGVELRIADDGEILVRGPLLMDGYWKLPKLSAEVLRDGWLHTGDIGVIDHDGYLQITDRKKDIIVTSAGDTLSPQRIEGILALEPEIDVAAVFGDNRPHLVAIVVPAANFVAAWGKERKVAPDLGALYDDKDFRDAISRAVERANASLSATERIKRFIVADQAFAIENGMMTPTMKPRRNEIVRRWGAALEALYR